MSRTYSERFLVEMHQADPERFGIKLAKACVKANIPALYVAQIIGVSRMTIYSWFRGKPFRDKNAQLAKKLYDAVEEALADGRLPASSLYFAQQFVKETRTKLELESILQ